jgi:hypothetical protein
MKNSSRITKHKGRQAMLRKLWQWYWEPFSPEEHSIREQAGIFVRKISAMVVFASIWTTLVFLVITILHFII